MPQRALGWVYAALIVVLVVAGIWWLASGGLQEEPPADGAEVGMVAAPPILPRT